jgi:splicing factor, arginine/serine-rich 4/5/6
LPIKIKPQNQLITNMEQSHKIFVGKLSDHTTEETLQKIFNQYGRVLNIDIKTGQAFIFYETMRECEDAVREMDGKDLDGSPIVVEIVRSGAAREKGRTSFPPPRGTRRLDLRVVIRNLHPRVSWQDLKDWARAAGDVTYANAFNKDGQRLGVVEYQVIFWLFSWIVWT